MNIRLPPLRGTPRPTYRLSSDVIRAKLGIAGNGRPLLPPPPDDVMDLLLGYDWPGNIRQLENVLEGAYILAGSETIGTHHLPRALQERSRGDRSRTELAATDKVFIEHTIGICGKGRGARHTGET